MATETLTRSIPNGNAFLSARGVTKWTPPPSAWRPLIHPRADEVAREVDGYFLEHFDFPSEKARQTFLNAGFSRVTCLYFPLAKDDRIHFACRLLTILFLIDDILEHMSFSEGEAYNEKLFPIMRGDVLPDRSIPVQYIMYDLWESMRSHDKALADEILEPVFTFMRSQTDRVRMAIKGLGAYLEYREKDVGKALLSALMRFSMSLQLSEAELEQMRPFEQNCSKQISVVNDIYSWEKELKASKNLHEEGAVLCSAVKVLADEAGLDIASSKRVLWSMTREWEMLHDYMYAQLVESGKCNAAMRQYIKGLEYQMSGNEIWSRTTLRYHSVE